MATPEELTNLHPAWRARALAVVLFVLALALPWLASAWGFHLVEPVSVTKLPATEVQYRPELVHIPGGSFWMGSTDEERARFLATLPAEVQAQKPFEDETRHHAEVRSLLVCRTEVTVAQWRAVMGTTPEKCTDEYGCDDMHPINGVSWNDACAYMEKLTKLENEVRQLRGLPALTQCYEQQGEAWAWQDVACTGFRLPTETEWEYAARGGTQTAYSFGDDADKMCAYGNGLDASGVSAHPEWDKPEQYGPTFNCDDNAPNLSRVGQYKHNPFGLYDVHGNVWEWAWDGYGPYPEKWTESYAGPDNADMRSLRGGSFYIEPWRLRSADRSRDTPSATNANIGFRCVRLAPQD